MKKIVRLTESDLARIVKRVLKEDWSPIDIIRGGGTSDEQIKKFINSCNSSTAPVDRKANQSADLIRNAVQGVGTNEQSVFSIFNSFRTWSEFCSVVKAYKESYNVSLYEDLDADIDSENEWLQIFRPLRNLAMKTNQTSGGSQASTPTTPKGADSVQWAQRYPCFRNAGLKYDNKNLFFYDSQNRYFKTGEYVNISTNQKGKYYCDGIQLRLVSPKEQPTPTKGGIPTTKQSNMSPIGNSDF